MPSCLVNINDGHVRAIDRWWGLLNHTAGFTDRGGEGVYSTACFATLCRTFPTVRKHTVHCTSWRFMYYMWLQTLTHILKALYSMSVSYLSIRITGRWAPKAPKRQNTQALAPLLWHFTRFCKLKALVFQQHLFSLTWELYCYNYIIFHFIFLVLRRAFTVVIVPYLGVTAGIEPAT